MVASDDFFRLFSLFFLLLALALTLFAQPALAQSPPAPADSSCDPEYFDTLKSRAWLEAQREVTQNQNLIFKPDSVLQYSCFDRHLNVVEQATQGMFSEGVDLDYVAANASTFVDSNFTNDPDALLGGRASSNYKLASSASPGAYNCDVMSNIWREARCMNFVDEADSDAFFTLKEYVDDAQDKRFRKGSCTKSANWGTEFDALTDTGTAWDEDVVETFFNKLDPTSCGTALDTGIRVLPAIGSESGYDEKFHIPPGCVYTP